MRETKEKLNIYILAGGFGTRLSDIIKDVPKPMAPIGDIPFLEYQIGLIKKIHRRLSVDIINSL